MWWDELSCQSRPNYSTQRVLVAIVPSRRDWDLVQRERWYRVPVKRAPKLFAADYVAFYHPRIFDEWRWTIRFYAPIERLGVATRRELLPQESDHPRADELYYKLQLGPLETLAHPIPSRALRRVTFISTTLQKLLTASDIGEFWLRERPGDRVRRAYRLRESGRAILREPTLAYALSR